MATDEAAGHASGAASYARGLLDRTAAGSANLGQSATLMQFLHCGAMLDSACAVIVSALAFVLERGGTR